MKGLSIILSLLIIVLSFQPCSDGNNADDLHYDELSISHNHQADIDDSCPITCACNCCGMTITYQPILIFNFETNVEISTLCFSTYQSNYRFDFHSSIWQPPKLIS